MKIFPLDFLNRMSCKNRNGVMLVNEFFKIFSQFFKIRLKYHLKNKKCFVTERLREREIPVLEWPRNSPNLKPIKSVW